MNGLYANIAAKRERIEKQKAAGKTPEKMRKPGSKGAHLVQIAVVILNCVAPTTPLVPTKFKHHFFSLKHEQVHPLLS